MAEDLGVAVLRLEVDDSKFKGSINNAEGKAKSLADNFKNVGSTLTKFVSLPLAGIGAASVKFASDLSESINAVNVVFGESSKAMHDFAQNSAELVGLARSDFNEMATVIGSQLKQSGLSMDKVGDQTINLVKRAADLASVFNTDVTTATQALGSALRGETEPARRFGINISEAAIQAEALALGLIEAGQAMTEQQKIQARLSLIMKQSAQVAGDFANTSSGLANSTRILQAELKDMLAELGTKLLPIATKAVRFVRSLVDSFSQLSEETKKTIMIVAGIGAAIGPAILALSFLVKGFSIVSTAFKAVGTLMAGMWPWGILIAAVVGVTVLVIKNWDKVKEATMSLWHSLSTIFTNMWNALKDSTLGGLLLIVGYFQDKFERIGRFIIDFAVKLVDTMKTALNPANWFSGDMGEQFKKIWGEGISKAFTDEYESLGNDLVKKGNELVKSATDSYNTAIGEIKDLWGNTVEAVTDVAVDIGDTFKGIFGKDSPAITGLESMIDMLKKAAEESEKVGIPGGTPIITTGGASGGGIIQTTSPTQTGGETPGGAPLSGWGEIGEKISSLVSGGSDIFSGFIDGIKNAFNSLVGFVRDPIGSIGNMFNGVLDGILGSISPLISMVMQLSNVMALVNWWQTILQGIMDVLGPIINKMLQPLVNILTIVGQLIGQMLLPLLYPLAELIKVISDIFLWVYNTILVPIANGIIYVFNVIHNAFADFVNAILKMIDKIPFVDVDYRVQKVDLESGFVEEITPEALTDTGGGADGVGGGGTTIEQARPIDITINITDNEIAGSDGFRELAIIIRSELESLGVINA